MRSDTRSDHESPLRQGAREMLPVLAALTPLALAVGVEAGAASAGAGAGWATGALIYGASAQLAAIGLLDAGAGPLTVVLAVIVVNARLALYSTAMAPDWADAGPRWRAVAAFLLVDPAYVTGREGYDDDTVSRRQAHDHYLGAALTLWVGWQVLTAAGLVVGDRVPAALDLTFAVPLCLLSFVVKQVESRGQAVAAGAAGVVAVAGHDWPMTSGLLVAIGAGIVAGDLLHRKDPS